MVLGPWYRPTILSLGPHSLRARDLTHQPNHPSNPIQPNPIAVPASANLDRHDAFHDPRHFPPPPPRPLCLRAGVDWISNTGGLNWLRPRAEVEREWDGDGVGGAGELHQRDPLWDRHPEFVPGAKVDQHQNGSQQL